jgi:hypothetical protein
LGPCCQTAKELSYEYRGMDHTNTFGTGISHVWCN